MPDTRFDLLPAVSPDPALRLVRVGGFGLNVSAINVWKDDGEALEVAMQDGAAHRFEGVKAAGLRWFLSRRSDQVVAKVDRDNGQRAEPVAVDVVDWLTQKQRLASAPPPHGARPDPKRDAVMAASASHWEDPDNHE